MGLQFEWDEEKEKINIAKHGIDFKTASHVFLDQNRLEFFDEKHRTLEEDRRKFEREKEEFESGRRLSMSALETADLSGTAGYAVPGLGLGLFGGNREGDPDHRERGQQV